MMSLFKTMNVKPELSVVIPAYNEGLRLPPTLRRMIPYLAKNIPLSEIVIANDGSKDNTVELVEEIAKTSPIPIRVISHNPNRGRGYAVRQGIAAAKGDFILETDSDGSVADEAIGIFLNYLKLSREAGAVFGSRLVQGAWIAEHQPILRVFLGHGFMFLSKIMLRNWRVRDFTLGFRMWKRDTAADVYAFQFDNHYVAEAEKVFVTKKRGWKFAELPVIWTDNRDSRISPIKESIRSFKGMLRIVANDIQGRYE